MKRGIVLGICFACFLVLATFEKVYAQEETTPQGNENTTQEETTSQGNESITQEETTSFKDVPETTTGKEIITSGWVKTSKGYRYIDSKGKYAATGIITVKGEKYYINKAGYRATGIIEYKGNKYYFAPKDGKMYRGTKLITYKNNKYYVIKGKVASGLKKIKKSYYYFSKKSGKMAKGKKFVTYKKNKYYIVKGKAATGLKKIKKNYYYFSKKNAKMRKNKVLKIKGVYYKFDKYGKGVKKTAAESYAIDLINRLCSPHDSNQTKLYKGFMYMVRNYHYGVKPGYFSPNSYDWVERFAYNMYTTHSGRCYSFAAAFCVYAREVGYTARAISGSVQGLRGGYVPHGWVEVVQDNGVYVYDPDLAVESKNAMAYYKRTYGAKRGWYRK